MDDELFGPLKRAHITQAVANEGRWSGEAQGLKIRFDLVPLAAGRRVAWAVKAPGWAHKGVSGTVFEALEEIGSHVARHTAVREEAPSQQSLF